MNHFNVKTTSVLLLSTCFGLAGCGQAKDPRLEDNAKSNPDKTVVAQLELSNPSQFSRLQQAVYVSYYDLGLAQDAIPQLEVVAQGKTIPSQNIDNDFDGKNDGLLFLSDFTEGQNQSYKILQSDKAPSLNGVKLTQAEISLKEGGSWVAHSKLPDTAFQEYVGGQFKNVNSISPPKHYTDHSNWIRYEGPGIESDKVGYRIYLDWRNGFDIFGKLVDKPVLQNVGLDGYESYHHKEAWGMDILKVGSSLGAGGFGLWHNNALSLVDKTDGLTATINENGDLRSSFTIDYKGWESTVGKQDFSAHFSMQGGSRLVKVNLDLSKALDAMAIGVVKHPDTTFIKGNIDITGKAYSYIASWGKQSLDGENLGMAVFFRQEYLQDITEDDKNYLAVVNPLGRPTAEKPHAQELEYYFAAVWQPESGIDSAEDFEVYLKQEAEKLTIKPRLRLTTTASTKLQEQTLAANVALDWSVRLADAELHRKTLSYAHDGWDVNRQRKPKFEYDIVGLYPQSYDELAKATGNKSYSDVLYKVTSTFIQDDGGIQAYSFDSYNIDSVAPGMALLRLYQQTGEDKYRKAADILREQLASQPKTSEGAFWHKKKYTGQLWLDGVYMGMPFLAEYSAMFEEGHSFDEVINEFRLTRKYLRDADTGLYYHAWDENKQQVWANKDTGLSGIFWGRGVGWLSMALVDTLDFIPEQNTEQRKVLLDMITELAVSLVKFQDQQTHTWWQVMDKPEAIGNYRESSASAMFTYFFAKAVNKGYLDESYRAVALEAYQGLINEFTLVHADGSVSMTNQCYVAGLGFGRDGSYQYYMSEPVWTNDIKGNFAFILSGIQIAELLKPL
ncbi:glycoside hydrolase family 88 protein [Paraglaciecola hydrolytica]|uniref:DNA-directed RNA polymerase subunit alpha n=1 Tax=Paraglaciecola hydrolytica TaxID=1799789 RepID=A0A136A1F4_9ALTE|nr:glycoside hydrolase family 88 protein [Paraglaciecola hydrolytica]KXI29065.1 DNA-directed RNA polymerase subunit alpha [Paraglaciecola hydrolytica]